MNRPELGTVFGRLTVLAYAPSRPGSKGDRKFLLCRCSCGTEKEMREDGLKSGIQSCGCLTREVAAYRARLPMSEGGHVTHNLSNTKAYSRWLGIRGRCFNPTNESYKDYGAKGIGISESWLSFENFYADMGECPEGMSIDRIDNSKGYSKENCRWATKKEQMDNRSNSVRYEYRGQLLSRSELAKLAGVSQTTMQQRLHKLHWTVEDAVNTPLRGSKASNKLTADPAVKLYRNLNDEDRHTKNCTEPCPVKSA